MTQYRDYRPRSSGAEHRAGTARSLPPGGCVERLCRRLRLENLIASGSVSAAATTYRPECPPERGPRHPSDPPTIGHALERSRLEATEPKAALRHDDSQREDAARQTLAIPTMTRVDQLGASVIS